MKKHQLITIISLLFTTYLSLSQEFTLNFTHLGETEGLKDNQYNYFVKKDSKGFTWISSQQGCYRYDGLHIKHFKLDEAGRYDENIQSTFHEDEHTNLWFTTTDALYCYRRKTDKFERKQFYKDSIILDYDYHAFYLNPKTNLLWLRTDSLIWAYNIQTATQATPYLSTAGKFFLVQPTSTGEASNIYAFPWFNKNGFEIWSLTNSQWTVDYRNEGLLQQTSISAGILDGDSILWLISNIGLLEYDLINKKVKKNYSPNGVDEFHILNGVLKEPHMIILASNGSGLWGFDKNKKRFTSHWTNSGQPLTGLSSDNALNVYLDYEEQLWVSQYSNGIDHTNLNILPFSDPLSKESAGLAVSNIIEDNEQRVWVLTKERGIYIFNQQQQLLHHYSTINGRQNFTLTHLSKGADGRIWLVKGTHIYLFAEPYNSLQNGTWNLIYKGEKRLKSLYHGIPQRKIVITISGVYDLLKSNSSWDIQPIPLFAPYATKDHFDYFFSANSAYTFLPFNSHDLWILQHGQNEPILKEELDFNAEIYDVCASQINQKIWVASKKGLYQFDQFGKYNLVLGSEELGGYNTVFAVKEDQNGNLWLSTNNGIWSFNPSSNKRIRYGKENGLVSNSFSQSAGLVATNGTIWFGSTKGLCVFDPNKIAIPSTHSAAYIDDLWINNKLYEGPTTINAAKEIILARHENTLAFSLRIVGANQSERSSIQYRLKGYQDSWLSVKSGQYANLPKVPPGTYQFEIVPINANHQRGDVRLLQIQIPPPFWQTIWFRLAAILSAIILIALSVRLYYQRQIRQQRQMMERQKVVNEERDRIAKELHDDMGGSLSSILFLSEDILIDEKEGVEKSQQTHRISTLAKNTLSNMKDIIWALDQHQNTVQDLSIRLQSYASTYLSDYQISLEYEDFFKASEQIELGSEKKRNLLLMVKECLHNIAKHAQASKVRITLHSDEKLFNLTIQDNGIGFEAEGESSKGNGLKNIIHRSKLIGGNIKINSSKGKGSSIELRVPL